MRLLMLAMGLMMLGLVSCHNDEQKPETPTKPTNTKKGNVVTTTEPQGERIQVFSIYDVEPSFTADNAQYDVKVFFSQALSEEDAVKIFDPAS